MSFGWGLGDFVAATELAQDAAQALTAEEVQEGADSVII